MGLLGWFFGGDKKEEQMKVGAGMHDTHSAAVHGSGMPAEGGMHAHHSGTMAGAKAAKDPVCGMSVNPDEAAATSVFQGTTYYFCAAGCKKAFDENPAKYVRGSKQMENGMHRGCC